MGIELSFASKHPITSKNMLTSFFHVVSVGRITKPNPQLWVVCIDALEYVIHVMQHPVARSECYLHLLLVASEINDLSRDVCGRVDEDRRTLSDDLDDKEQRVEGFLH
jgi:hypothetical protein